MSKQTYNEIERTMRFNNVRLAFPHLYEMHTPQGSPGAKPAYSVELIIDPVVNAEEWKQMESIIMDMASAMWPDITEQVLGVIQKDRKLRCFGKGEEKLNNTTMKPLDGFEGKLWVSARNVDRQPDLYAPNKKRIDPNDALDTTSPKFYGGCIANVAIKLWLQNNTYGRAIRCELVALQFARDGEPFASHQVDTASMFEPIKGAPAPTAGNFEPDGEANAKGSLSFM